MAGLAPERRPREPIDGTDPTPEEWRAWIRDDLLRYWYFAAALAWDALGIAEVRDLLDPWHPNQDWSPPYVYVTMAVFLVVSIIVQMYLYQRLWGGESVRRGRFVVWRWFSRALSRIRGRPAPSPPTSLPANSVTVPEASPIPEGDAPPDGGVGGRALRLRRWRGRRRRR